MSKRSVRDPIKEIGDDLLPHYDFDYSKARPNRFAQPEGQEVVAVTLDPDVAKVFGTPKKANAALRSLLTGGKPLARKPAIRRKAVK